MGYAFRCGKLHGCIQINCLTRIKNYVKKTKTYSDSGAILSSTAAKYNAHIGDADSGVNGEH